MEQIQRALLRARRQKELNGEGGKARRGGAHNLVFSGNGRVAPPTAPPPEDLSRIQYTRTRRVEPDRALLRERRLVAHLGNDAAGNLFRVLRAQVLQKLRRNGLKTLAVIGPTAGVGKSMVAANLSLAMSRETNQTVLLADLDLRRPRVGWYFGLDEDEPGIADFLHGEKSVEELLINPGFDRLVLLPGSRSFEDASELLTSPRMVELLEELRHRYHSRFVLADLPPLLSADDAIAVLPHIDAALLVVEDGVTTAEQIAECKRLLADTPLVGVVLNKSELASQSAYYGYQDAYEKEQA